ncbi:acyltransferase [Paracrocinitomix mangrovi]|uniref:acyltransferase family protein n=1 Tax=Paracrocinitomix mangrovi TaxID=2862509 RepID=UPI001C8D2FCD|nr:acyltransferase [Paracrocinitomix mangrovi]UKN01981.1 acyltransferase [Paracrocinitomix mangrovi]
MKYIKGYDTLRAFSIILVLINHLGVLQFLPETDFYRQRVWLLVSGTTGVQIFFTLSGFLITRILLQELNEHRSIKFVYFYIRRFLRLLPPLIIFYTVVAILMSQNMLRPSAHSFLLSFAYMYNFVPNKLYIPELGHTWSLALEEQYYLIWPFIINFLNKKLIYVFIALIIMACFAALYIYPQYYFVNHYKTERWFIPAVAPVIIGSLAALLINQKDAVFGPYFKQKYASVLVGLLLFLFPLYTPFIKPSFIVQSIGISLFLVWLLYNQESRLTAILNNKLTSYIGRISYGIYVYQGLFLRTSPGGELWIQKFPQNIILTLLVAILSFELIEKAVLKRKRNFSRAK